jgi:hypothetical protein
MQQSNFIDGPLARHYNPPGLFSRFACLYPGESKCSKWLNSSFINNWTLLISFVLFHECWNLQLC